MKNIELTEKSKSIITIALWDYYNKLALKEQENKKNCKIGNEKYKSYEVYKILEEIMENEEQ